MLKKITDMLIGPALPPPPGEGGSPAVQGPTSGDSGKGLLDYAAPAAAVLAIGGAALIVARRVTR